MAPCLYPGQVDASVVPEAWLPGGVAHVGPRSRFSFRNNILALVKGLLFRIQFSHNHELFQLDDDTLSDDNLTELDEFRMQCIGIIALAGELYPGDVIREAYAVLEKHGADFCSIHLKSVSFDMLQALSVSRMHFACVQAVVLCWWLSKKEPCRLSCQ